VSRQHTPLSRIEVEAVICGDPRIYAATRNVGYLRGGQAVIVLDDDESGS
jgi:hypothetical protein